MKRLKNHSLCILFFLITVAWYPAVFALRIDPASYHYPYRNPYLATSTVPIMRGVEDLPFVKIMDLDIEVLLHRNNVYLLENQGKLRCRFYAQYRLAPLVFIVPGLGGSAWSGYVSYVAELFAGHGFHVLVLPSPFNWNFALAASTSGFPGLTQKDSEDLYSVMQLALNRVKQEYGARVGKIGMMGFSDGALYTGYVSNLDTTKGKIGIDTYLLVNPPVDLLAAIGKIDRMAELGESLSTEQKNNLEAYGFGVVGNARQNDPGERDYFAHWNRRFVLTDRQIQYLIGNELRMVIGDVIYVEELVHKLGVLRTPVRWGSRSGRMEEARSYSIMGYVQRFLIPRLAQSGSAVLNLNELNHETSLKGIESALQRNKNIYLLHNNDDFLVSENDLDYLESIFGHRAKIYPYGGHLGNLWYDQNRKDMVEIFHSFLDSCSCRARTGGLETCTRL